MFTALAILVCGIAAGRLLRSWIPRPLLARSVMGAIFLLLFLLGVSIGGNSGLLRQLPSLGLDALALMLFCVGGSIIASMLITPFLRNSRKIKANKARHE